MNANLEMIRDLLDLHRTAGWRPLQLTGSIAGRMSTYAGHMLRTWGAPAARSAAWWTAKSQPKAKIDLNDPAFHRHSDILHELTRRF